MSELKRFNVVGKYSDEETMLEYRPDGIYYDADEADKVIAEKDAEIAELIEKNKRLANKDIIMASETIKDLYKELRHSKYKRCLAMAKYCELREDEFGGDFAKRWLKKWLELAEEPTWAKFLQLIHKEEKLTNELRNSNFAGNCEKIDWDSVIKATNKPLTAQ